MAASHPDFFDDTSMSESLRSLVKTSTVAKEDIKWNEDAFFKRQELAKASESLFLPVAESPISANAATARSALDKVKIPLNYSVTSGENSSLGILNMENFDLSGSSLQEPIKLGQIPKAKKSLKRSSKIGSEEKKLSETNEVKYFSKSSEVNLETKHPSKADAESDTSSDIEYDGTNIPELNFDCDILSLLSANKARVSSGESANDTNELQAQSVDRTETIPKERSTMESFYRSSQMVEDELSKSDATDIESSSTRHSIFENFQPQYDSLYDQILSGKQSVGKKKKAIKVCPFLGMSSFEIDPILSKPNQSSAYSDVENTRFSQDLSVEFCPEEISARSSFKSSRQFESPTSSSGLSNFGGANSLYQHPQSGQEEYLENAVFSRSQFQLSKHNLQSFSEGGKSVNGDKDSGLSADSEKLSESPSKKSSVFGNFSFPSNLEFKNISGFGSEEENWCSRLGISESDFFSADAAKEILKKEKEEIGKNHLIPTMTNKTGSGNSWSPTSQLEVTAPSWFKGISPDRKEAGDRHISIGTLFGAMSENIGTLSKEVERERPYFGKVVKTPEKITSSTIDPLTSETSYGSDSEDNSIGKMRISALSALLEDISTSDPMEFASELVKKCSAAFQSDSKMGLNDHDALNKEIGFEEPKPCRNRRCTLEESNSTLVKSLSASNLSKRSDLDGGSKTATPEPALCDSNSLNLSDSSSCRGSIKTTKSDTCSNCSEQLSRQKFSWPRPCSSACSIPLAANNALCVRYGSMNHLNSCCVNSCQNCLHGLLHHGANSELSGSAPNLQSLFQGALPAPLLMSGASTPYLEIKVVPELNFPKKVSVGDSQEVNLTIHNSANISCCYKITSTSAYLDESFVPREMSGLICDKMVPSNVGGATDTTLMIAPIYSGKFIVHIKIDAFLNSIAEALNVAPVATAKTKIQYEAVQPSITMLSKGKDTLNIGQVVAGSTFVEYITIRNNSDVAVPLRIRLSENASSANQIYFGLKKMNQQMHPSSGMLQFLSPKVLLYRIPATQNESFPSSFEIPIVFESVNGRVDAAVTAAIETPTFHLDLAFLPISASSGDAKLVLQDPAQNPLILKATINSICNYSVNVMNDGSLPVVYDLHIEGDGDVFAVKPMSVNLQPKQCANILITFTPTTHQTARGNLLAAAEPHGQVCTVAEIIGQVKESAIKLPSNIGLLSQTSRKPTKAASDSSSKSDLISCNKKFLDWSGVEIDKCKVSTCLIRNNKLEKLPLKLWIKDKNRAFLLIEDSGTETTMYNLTLQAREEKAISVAFTPRSLLSYHGFLGIISADNNQSRDKIKFLIPLNGYGGTSKIKILNLPDREGTGYCLDVDVSDGEDVVYKNFVIQNVGCRPAFVKLSLTYGIAQNVAGIQPSEFVLLENEKRNILVSVNCSNKNFLTSNEVISVFYGDEIMRQRLRRKLSSSRNLFAGCDIDFNVPYDGEEKVPYDMTWEPSPNEEALFNSHLKTSMIHLFLNNQNAAYGGMSFTNLSAYTASFSDLSLNSTQALRCLTTDDHSSCVKDSASSMNGLSGLKFDSWTVQPEELLIDAENQEKRIVLKSHSNSDLRFKVEWNINVISISPITGILFANKEIGLRLTLIHTNHNKLFEDYEGFIKILCNKAEKNVTVKVCKNLRRTRAATMPSNLDETLRSGILGDSYFMDATIVVPGLNESSEINVENIFNFPKVIDLMETRQGCVSETILIVCNSTQNTVIWNIHPSTMILSQPFDDALDSSSSAIEFCVSNGSLRPSEKDNIVIKFSPSSVAHFSRFFELVLTSENGRKQTTNFKVQGEAVVNFPTTAQARNFEKDVKQVGSRKKAKAEIYCENEICEFPTTAPGQKSMQSIKLINVSDRDNQLRVASPKHPFSLKHSSLPLRSRKYISVPLYFKPQKPGIYEGEVKFVCENGNELRIKLNGLCSV